MQKSVATEFMSLDGIKELFTTDGLLLGRVTYEPDRSANGLPARA